VLNTLNRGRNITDAQEDADTFRGRNSFIFSAVAILQHRLTRWNIRADGDLIPETGGTRRVKAREPKQTD
jgi:hypothetical protein